MTYIKMKFILGVTLLAIQLSSTRAGIASATADLVTYINGENFVEAFSEARELGYNLQTAMNAAIRQVYSNDDRNIEIILKFVNSNRTETRVNFAVFTALDNLLQSDVDYLYRLKIMKSFNSNFNCHQEEENVKNLKNKLHNSVSNVVVEDLKNALKNKNSPKVSALCKDINAYYPESFDEVIRQVLDKALDEIDTPYLIQFFVNHNNPPQSMSVYLAAYKNLKKKNRLNESVLVTIASGVKEALDKSADLQTVERGENLRDELPLSVKNIAFANPIYIVNQNGEYLYAESDEFITDVEKLRRPIFTWTPKERVNQGVWGIERQGSFTYLIKNIRSSTPNEYLYMYGPYNTADDHSYVYTWRPGGTDDYNYPRQFDWVFEPSGDYVYIRNTHRKEYLYVTNEFRGTGRRKVYTHHSGNKVDGSLWKIVE